MSARERIGVGAACVFWEVLWLFSLVLQVEFFNVPPPPAAQTWCDPDAACELIAFNQWLDTLPRWTRFIPLAITIVFGFIWAHSECGSGLRKLSGRRFRRGSNVGIHAPAQFRHAAGLGYEHAQFDLDHRHGVPAARSLACNAAQ